MRILFFVSLKTKNTAAKKWEYESSEIRFQLSLTARALAEREDDDARRRIDRQSRPSSAEVLWTSDTAAWMRRQAGKPMDDGSPRLRIHDWFPRASAGERRGNRTTTRAFRFHFCRLNVNHSFVVGDHVTTQGTSGDVIVRWVKVVKPRLQQHSYSSTQHTRRATCCTSSLTRKTTL